MRILLVDLESAWRGGQSQALLLLQGLLARGHSVELLSVRGAALAQRAQSENIPVSVVSRTLRRARAAARMRTLLRDPGFDVVHANEAHALTAAWLAGAHRRATLVAARRVVFPLGTGTLSRVRYRAARRIIAISRFAAQIVEDSGVPARRVEVVYDGVEIPPPSSPDGSQEASMAARRAARERWGIPEGQPLLGCVGYLLPGKGQEFLVRALPEIRARFPGCRLLLAGDGPCRARLERIATELNLQSAVHFAGYVRNVSEVYAALDVFIFPSLAEALGSSLLAAMAAGLPVIAVASGGVSEAVAGGAGLLLPDPSPKGIAEAAVRLLSNPAMAASLGQTARKIIQDKFSADRMVESTLQAYERARAGG